MVLYIFHDLFQFLFIKLYIELIFKLRDSQIFKTRLFFWLKRTLVWTDKYITFTIMVNWFWTKLSSVMCEKIAFVKII
jgi:hypothetical protein